MEVKPNVAFTGSPILVERASGTAWKALWIIACPSMRMSFFLFISVVIGEMNTPSYLFPATHQKTVILKPPKVYHMTSPLHSSSLSKTNISSPHNKLLAAKNTIFTVLLQTSETNVDYRSQRIERECSPFNFHLRENHIHKDEPCWNWYAKDKSYIHY
jgi:hypothetical protein